MILEFDGIQFSYNENPLLSGIYIKCEYGKVTGLLGRNGSGKSTLLQVVFGSLRADVISVRIDQVPLSLPAFRTRKVSYLPQNSFIPSSLSLRKILSLYNVNEDALLQDFPELEQAILLRANELSGGTLRLFEILLVLNSPAPFCLLDEPFTGLTPALIERLSVSMNRLKLTKGILITDHLYRQVIGLSDSLYLLTNGRTYVIQSEMDLVQRGYIV